MRRIRLLEAAKQEALDAAAWYEYERVGLGHEFLLTLDRVLDLLEQEIVPTETLVVAVAHQSRRPGYWWNRLDDHKDD